MFPLSRKLYSTLLNGASKFKSMKLVRKLIHSGMNRYSEEKYALRDIKEQFRHFNGGRISLRKDDTSGIAYVGMDHVEKKNGLSGTNFLKF